MRIVAFLCMMLAVSMASADVGAKPSAPGSGCAVENARRVQNYYNAISDLVADFEQKSEVASLAGKSLGGGESRGEVTLAKPGKMRWRYVNSDGSDASLVVSDGKVLWIYDLAAREAQRFSVEEGFLSGAAMQFLFGEGDLLQSFVVTSKSCVSPVVLSLVPREAATYEKLELEVDAKTGQVIESAVFDIVGNVTRVRFANLRINQKPKAQVFSFDPPKGVRVLEALPAF